MSRVLAFSDLHLGAGTAYSDDRLADQEQVLDRIAGIAKERDVSLVAIAGDIFDRPRPAPPALHVFQRFARRLADAGIPAVAVHGNLSHDIAHSEEASPLELFATPMLKVFRTADITLSGDVVVAVLPSVPVHRLVAASDGGDRAEIFEQASRLLICAAHGLFEDAQQIGDGRPTVLVTHFAISGNHLPHGLPTDTLNEPILPLDELQDIGFDAVVAGHIHVPGVLAEKFDGRPVISLGSPMTLNFGEEHLDHGCWIIDLAPGAAAVASFEPIASRRFVTVDVDLTDPLTADHLTRGLDETDVIVAHIAEELPLTDAVVRIRYRCTEAQDRAVNKPALKKFCLDAGAHRVYQVQPEIIRQSRARAEGVDETLEPLAAVAAWANVSGLDQDQTTALCDLVAELLGERVRA